MQKKKEKKVIQKLSNVNPHRLGQIGIDITMHKQTHNKLLYHPKQTHTGKVIEKEGLKYIV